MQLSRRSDYALRAVRFCARLEKNRYASINLISRAENIPPEYLAKILNSLVRGGVLVSHRGINGGYELARMPSDVTFLDIIEIIDGPIRLSVHTSPDKSRMSLSDAHYNAYWQELQESFRGSLSRQDFGRFSREHRKLKFMHNE